MFRIKNVRNATVAKTSSIPQPQTFQLPHSSKPQIPPPKPTPTNNKLPMYPSKPPPQRQLLRKNENLKIKASLVQQRTTLTKPRQNEANIKKVHQDLKKAPEHKKEEVMEKNCVDRDTKEKKITHIVVDCSKDCKSQLKKQKSQINLLPKQTCQEDTSKNERLAQEEREEKERQYRKAEQQRILREQKEKMRLEEEQAREEARKAREEERRLRKQRQEEEQAANEAKMQELFEKANARRKARQEEKQRRLNFERQLQNQQVGGIVSLSDPLSHVEMSEAVMDAQVNMLLNMKFAGYPNRQALEHQVEELERINRSYLLVRTDPNNPLIRGLSNFRVELFNRVGELIMQAQAEMGPSASGLQMMQADSRNFPQVKGMHVTRGMEGHLSTLKKCILQKAEECAICLEEVLAGLSVYDVGCGHKFHERCLEDWLNSNGNCPACRYNIKFGHP